MPSLFLPLSLSFFLSFSVARITIPTNDVRDWGGGEEEEEGLHANNENDVDTCNNNKHRGRWPTLAASATKRVSFAAVTTHFQVSSKQKDREWKWHSSKSRMNARLAVAIIGSPDYFEWILSRWLRSPRFFTKGT